MVNRWGMVEPPVRVLGVVKGEPMYSLDMGFQVAFLRGTVGTVLTLERSLTCWGASAEVGLPGVHCTVKGLQEEGGQLYGISCVCGNGWVG